MGPTSLGSGLGPVDDSGDSTGLICITGDWPRTSIPNNWRLASKGSGLGPIHLIRETSTDEGGTTSR